MREIDSIILHCSDSQFGNAELIDHWHKERGWKRIGYHFIILNGLIHAKSTFNDIYDGALETGRELKTIGAHCKGFNRKSIGVCMIGKAEFTDKQFDTLTFLYGDLCQTFGKELGIFGHYELDSKKTCPNVMMDDIRQRLVSRHRIRRHVYKSTLMKV